MNAHANLRPGKYRLRVSDYLSLDDAGAFNGEPTELVDGDVIVISPEWVPHMRIKDELAYQFRRAIEDRGLNVLIGTAGSVALSDVDMPRPDIIVMAPFTGEKAVPREAARLFVEVSSSTLSFDLDDKAARYAEANVPEYWVADVNSRIIHQMWAPANGGYSERREVTFGERIAAATIPALAISTAGL